MDAGAIAAVAVLAAATAAGLARRRRDGRFRGRAGAAAHREDDLRLTEADLGRPLGEKATLVQFSSAFCAPCRAARVVLSDVAARADGVAHVEVDVAQRPDLVRRLDVSRTPTIFVLGPRGALSRRASGVPRRADVTAAISEAAVISEAAGAGGAALRGRGRP